MGVVSCVRPLVKFQSESDFLDKIGAFAVFKKELGDNSTCMFFFFFFFHFLFR